MLLNLLTLLLAADDTRPAVVKEMGSDYFTAGQTVSVTQPVPGDLMAAGGDVGVDANTAGDAVLAGGTVRVNGRIDHNLYLGGGRLSVNGVISRNARMAGGEIDIAPSAEITNLSVAGGQVRMLGKVTGYLQAAAERLYLNGPVAGDVEATARKIELGPLARIGGKLRYRTEDGLTVDPAAQVTGGTERLATPKAWMVPAEEARRGNWIWTMGLMLAAAALLALLPSFFADATKTLQAHVGRSALLGFVLLVCVPIAALILLITRVGAPLGLLVTGGYLALLLLGYLTTGAALGDWILHRFVAGHDRETLWRIGAAAGALLLFALVGQVPWLGGLTIFFALLAGLGALGQEIRKRVFVVGGA